MDKLFAKIKKETLSQDEKIKILSSLRNFVAENPVQSIKSPFYEEWFVFRHRAIAVPIAIVFIFTMASSTVFAAKNSLPSDILYPVKMLGEKVESIIATNPKAKAQIEALHAISRLQEVEKMVASNQRLDKGSGQEIGNNFGTQVKDVVTNINELKNSGKTEDASVIWSDFSKSVVEHEKKIAELSNSTSTEDETKKELDRVVSNVRSQIENSLNEYSRKSEKTNNENSHEASGTNTTNETTDSNQTTNGEVKGAEIKQNTETEKNNSSESERKGD